MGSPVSEAWGAYIAPTNRPRVTRDAEMKRPRDVENLVARDPPSLGVSPIPMRRLLSNEHERCERSFNEISRVPCNYGRILLVANMMMRTVTLFALVAAACGFSAPMKAARLQRANVRMGTKGDEPIKVGINGARTATS